MKNIVNKASDIIRQGDVILVPVGEIPSEAKKVKDKVLQHSEISGHHHHFRQDSSVTLYQVGKQPLDQLTITPDFQKYIEVAEPELLYHGKGFVEQPAATGTGDHNALSVQPGLYKVVIKREYDYNKLEPRQVYD